MHVAILPIVKKRRYIKALSIRCKAFVHLPALAQGTDGGEYREGSGEVSAFPSEKRLE